MTTTARALAGRRSLLTGVGLTLVALLGASACDRDESNVSTSPSTTAHDHESHDHSTDAAAAEANKPDVDPCTLMTEAEAEAILGPVTKPFESDAAGGTYAVVPDSRTCRYTLEGETVFGATVGLTDHEAKSKYEDMAKQYEGVSAKVDGVGDAAIWIEPFRTVLAIDGDALVTVQILDKGMDAAPLKDKAVDLVTAAFETLEQSKD